jgi:catechol 2,3-dioxygenase-like lactoylglutathione lyase family enzyme
MTINSLDHYNIQTARLEETVAFYTDVLGFSNGYRPGVRGTGAWLYAGGRPIVHINVVDADMAGPTGPINHVAFETANAAGDYEAMQARLAERGLPFEVNDSRPIIPLRQIFVHDPNGIRLELNYRDAPLVPETEGV